MNVTLEMFQDVYDMYIKPDKVLIVNRKHEDKFIDLMTRSGRLFLPKTRIEIMDLEGDTFAYLVDLKKLEELPDFKFID